MRKNVKDKLRNLHIPQGVMNDFLNDIFGKQIGNHFEAGLVYAESESSFRAALSRLKCRWNNLEKSCSTGSSEPEFHSWFCKFKAEDIIKCVLPAVRSQAGADSQCLFTTNSSESLNHVIKMEVQWKENKLPFLISHLENITMQHQSEMEKAIIGRGEWSLCLQYASLQVVESMWFCRMTPDEKQKHLKKVQTSQVMPASPVCTSGPISSQQQSTGLSVPIEAAGLPTISSSTLNCMWSKAATLILTDGHILKVPWLSDPKARLVKSSSSLQPHVVQLKPNSKSTYVCDSNCPMFKGFSLCSHVVAVAEVNGDLPLFLKAIQSKCNPNLTAIASHGFSCGSGRKGGIPKRKRKTPTQVESRSVRQSLQSQTTLSHLNTIPGAHATSLPTASTSRTTVSHSNTIPGAHATSLPTASTSTMNTNAASQDSSGFPSATLLSTRCTPPALPPNTLSAGVTHSIGMVQACSTHVHYPTFPSREPFVFKFKTKQIRICQSCRKGYDGSKDTLDLVVARAERRLVSNLATGVQFLGKESNSHYHAHKKG